jgi:hypothetical protein
MNYVQCIPMRAEFRVTLCAIITGRGWLCSRADECLGTQYFPLFCTVYSHLIEKREAHVLVLLRLGSLGSSLSRSRSSRSRGSTAAAAAAAAAAGGNAGHLTETSLDELVEVLASQGRDDLLQGRIVGIDATGGQNLLHGSGVRGGVAAEDAKHVSSDVLHCNDELSLYTSTNESTCQMPRPNYPPMCNFASKTQKPSEFYSRDPRLCVFVHEISRQMTARHILPCITFGARGSSRAECH